MPHLDADTFALPFSGSTPLSRHTSHQGALSASERVGRQALALLTLYKQEGPLTDREAAERMGVERSTVNARRSELQRRGLVIAIDTIKAESGVRNVRWGIA